MIHILVSLFYLLKMIESIGTVLEDEECDLVTNQKQSTIIAFNSYNQTSRIRINSYNQKGITNYNKFRQLNIQNQDSFVSIYYYMIKSHIKSKLTYLEKYIIIIIMITFIIFKSKVNYIVVPDLFLSFLNRFSSQSNCTVIGMIKALMETIYRVIINSSAGFSLIKRGREYLNGGRQEIGAKFQAYPQLSNSPNV